MNIGIITNHYFFSDEKSEINKLIINKICEKLSDEKFYLFSTEQAKHGYFLPKNLHHLKLPTGIIGILSRDLQNKISIKKLLKINHINATIFFDDAVFINTEVPQWQVMNSRIASDVKNFKLLEKAKGIIVTTIQDRDDIVQQLPAVAKNIINLEGIRNQHFAANSYDSKLDTREKYTEGKEFFLCSDINLTSTKFVLLLKAFSLFKQRLQSNWKLFVALRSKKQKKELEELLSTYKYRYDVALSNITEDELHYVTASAYAVIVMDETGIYPLPVFEALACEVPVIALTSKTMAAYKNAALLAKGSEPAALAEKMMELYKDENMRNKYIKKGRVLIAQYKPEKAIEYFSRQLLQGQG